MTDLLHTIPEFPTKHYTHLLPSLEKSLITTTDLLTLDALDVAKRAQLPLLEVRRLKEHILALLQSQLGLDSDLFSKFENVGNGKPGYGELRKNGHELVRLRGCISTLDPALDEALGGGIQTGYVTEITGESGAGKTQLLLTLLLSAQLPPSSSNGGLGRPTCYISTEHPLPTTRVHQILTTNPLLTQPPSTPSLPGPSMTRILTLQTPDLESQDHILTYQLPIVLARHQIGLVIIDSIAANYRAESTHDSSRNPAAALATRSAQLVKVGALLRNLAREHDCAIVVANQVSDRFAPLPAARRSATQTATATTTTTTAAEAAHPSTSHPYIPSSSPAPSTTSSTTTTAIATPALLSLDHQQRFFTGWGDAPPPHQPHNLKTPSLGLVWANQISSRIALIKEESYDRPVLTAPPTTITNTTTTTLLSTGNDGENKPHQQNDQEQTRQQQHPPARAEWTPHKWRRWMRVVFAPWVAGCAEGDPGVEFEVWRGGVRSVAGGNAGRDKAEQQ